MLMSICDSIVLKHLDIKQIYYLKQSLRMYRDVWLKLRILHDRLIVLRVTMKHKLYNVFE
jgi:hypothetical protein